MMSHIPFAGPVHRARTLLSKLSHAALEQVAVSATTFLISFLLIREFSPSDFALFGVILSVVFIYTGVQNALITTPLTVTIGDRSKFASEDEAIANFAAINSVFLLIAATSLGLLGFVLAGVETAIAVFFYAGCYSLRQFLRGVEFARGRPARNFKGSLLTLALTVSFLLGFKVLTLSGVFYALAISYMAACLLSWKTLPLLLKAPSVAVLRTSRQIRSMTSWSLGGVLISHAMTDGVVLLSAATLPPTSVAALVGSRLLIQPFDALLLSASNILRPHWAKKLTDGDAASVLTNVLQIGVAVFVGAACWAAAVLFALPLLHDVIFDQYAVDLIFMIALIRLATLAPMATRKIVGLYLQSSQNFKSLSQYQFLALIVAYTVGAVGYVTGKLSIVLSGVLVSELMLMGALIAFAKNALKPSSRLS